MASTDSANRPTRGYAPDERSAQRLVAAGLKPMAIYRGDKGQTPDKFKMRKGEYLGVVNGLLAFGDGVRAITAAVKHVHATGATVIDVETGKDSRADGVEMLKDAQRGPVITPEQARIMQEASVDQRIKGRMPVQTAREVWFGYPLLTTKMVLQMMPKWARATAHNTFGPRKVPAGRRPKQSKR